MVGSTSRCDLKVQNPAYGLCSQGVTGVNSDVIMILHLDWNQGRVSVLSIPRDTFIPNARTTGANKIDAALAEGPTQLVKAVEEDFAIPIQHFVELNFETFASVVDVLGGIDMYFPTPLFDAYSGLVELSAPKCNHLNGTQALQVVRARHLQYWTPGKNINQPSTWTQENLSDLARIRRDQEFLRVMSAAMTKKGLGNPITDARLISAVAPHLTTDQGFSAQHMLDIISKFKGVNPDNAPQFTLPVMTSNSYSYIYKGGNYGNVAFPVNAADISTIYSFLGVSGYWDTWSNRLGLKPSEVTAAVVNGSGTPGQAQATATQLSALGFHISSTGDTTPVGNPALTVVAYNSMDSKVIAAAQSLWHSLSGQTILAYEPDLKDPVTLITGTAFAVNPPVVTTTTLHGTTTTKPKSSTTTSTTTTTIPAVPGFQTPNTSTAGLEPWDPRACNPKGGPGK
jgi:LCP family protein required for cell wall assembly